MVLTAFLVDAQHERNNAEKKLARSIVVLGKTINWIPQLLRGIQVASQSNKKHVSRALAHTRE